MKKGKIFHKYNAKQEVYNGIKFSSKKEAKRYRELELLQKNGDISHFHHQIPIRHSSGIVYRCDFQIFWLVPDRHVTYEDVKGMRTSDYKLKKKMIEAEFPFEIVES